MKLTIPLQVFLTREKASVRLHNLLNTLWFRELPKRHLTVSQFIEDWPLARLRKEVFGFGPKMQAELCEILERHVSCNTGQRYAKYFALLKPKRKAGWTRDSLPDSDTTVLVRVDDYEEPIATGYHDGDCWRFTGTGGFAIPHPVLGWMEPHHAAAKLDAP